MNILVFGRTGQVARELSTRRDVIALGREDVDLADADACGQAIARIGPSSVINAAAYTAVDRAEDEEELAMLINADAPGAMARVCAKRRIPFVHLSTDYVFDGTGTEPITPETDPAPLSAYGRSKLAGERAIVRAGGTYAFLRTSWVFSAHGNNFVKAMLRLSKERGALSIVSDQCGGPTSAGALASACLRIADALAEEPGKTGAYHLSGAPETSWADFAREIFAQSGTSCEVVDIPTSDYPTAATRPLNSRLDCTSTKQAFGIDRPDWRTDLRAVLDALTDEEV